MQTRSRYTVYLAVFVLPFLVLLHLWSHLELERFQMLRSVADETDHRVPAADRVSPASLNHTTAAADLFWIGMILYTSDRQMHRQSPEAVTDYAETISTLDPHFGAVYPWHNVFRYRTHSHADLDDLREANRILEKGLEYFPDDWQLARTIALNNHDSIHRYDLQDQDRVEALEKAVDYAEKAADIEGSPPVMTGLADNFRRQLDSLRDDGDRSPEIDEEFLVRRYWDADDDRERRFIRQQLAEIGAEDRLVERIEDHDRQFQRHHRTRYPYLSHERFALIDPLLYTWRHSDHRTIPSPPPE